MNNNIENEIEEAIQNLVMSVMRLESLTDKQTVKEELSNLIDAIDLSEEIIKKERGALN